MEEITLNNNDNKTEAEFLEMANDCMERISQKNNEIKRYKDEIHNIESRLCEIYGCYKKLSKYIDGISEIDTNIDFLMREIENDLHHIIFHRDKPQTNFNFVINFNQNDDDDEDY